MRTTKLAPKDYPANHYPWPRGFKIDARGRFCGRYVSEWQKIAHRDVVEALVRASMQHDTRNAPGAMASERLMRMARDIDTKLVDAILKESARVVRNISRVMSAFMLTPAERRRLAKRKKTAA